SSRRRQTRCYRDWSSDVCSSDLAARARGLNLISVSSPHAHIARTSLSHAVSPSLHPMIPDHALVPRFGIFQILFAGFLRSYGWADRKSVVQGKSEARG